jgi:hypothetical protein
MAATNKCLAQSNKSRTRGEPQATGSAASIRRAWVPLLFFLGLMVLIHGAGELIGTDGLKSYSLARYG